MKPREKLEFFHDKMSAISFILTVTWQKARVVMRAEMNTNVTDAHVIRGNQITWTVMRWSALENSFIGRNDKQFLCGEKMLLTCVLSFVEFQVLFYKVDKVGWILTLRQFDYDPFQAIDLLCRYTSGHFSNSLA